MTKRKAEHLNREEASSDALKLLAKYDEKIEDLKESKTWISDEERKEVTDRVAEIRTWINEQMEA
jgi:HPt (histidine-containing phosphotransfer) domain-containing protein